MQELEEKLMDVEKERDVKEMGLVNTINKLKVENQFLLKSIEQMRSDISALKSPNGRGASTSGISNTHSTSQYSMITQYKSTSPNRSVGSPSGSSSYSVQQISPAPSADSPPVFTNVGSSRTNSTPMSNNNTPGKPASNSQDFDCGVCVKEECLCESVGLKEPETNDRSLQDTLASFKPMPAVALKSKKRKISDTSTLEIDFTKKFATSKPMPDLKKLKKSNNRLHALAKTSIESSSQQFNAESPVDNCGFCTDDTPCVCREAAKEAALFNDALNSEQDESNGSRTPLPPIQINTNNIRKSSLPVMHPGPSVEVREIANLTPGAVPTVVGPTTRMSNSMITNENSDQDTQEYAESPAKTAGGCTGNPGTCEQCQMDPMSTLFCTTVANKEKDDNESDTKPSPSESKTSEVLKTSNELSISRTSSRTSLPSISITDPSSQNSDMFIPCSDAYKTLSRHKKFNSVDFSTLVGKLTTRGMQVEVQSVANVLRELDRRVYN